MEFLESGKMRTPQPDQNNAHTINKEGYNDTTQSLLTHRGHASGVDEIMNAITIL